MLIKKKKKKYCQNTVHRYLLLPSVDEGIFKIIPNRKIQLNRILEFILIKKRDIAL